MFITLFPLAVAEKVTVGQTFILQITVSTMLRSAFPLIERLKAVFFGGSSLLIDLTVVTLVSDRMTPTPLRLLYW